MTAPVDLTRSYLLSPDLMVIERDATTIQIGTERPRRILLVDAPPRAAAVLDRLDGTRSVAETIAENGGDPLVWRTLLQALHAADMLVSASRPAPGRPRPTGERAALTHRYGAAAADRMLTARSDAVVVVDGSGPAAPMLASLLATAGIGHVHPRAPRQGEPRQRYDRAAKIAPTRPPAEWRSPPDLRVHRPAPQVRPTVVVLTSGPPPDAARAAELVTLQVPHLPVGITQARILVGPLVLPGRSACLNCLDRYRLEADPGWSTVARRLRDAPVAAAAVPVATAAGLAAEQVLDLVDGLRRPAAVNTTLERRIGQVGMRRRHWRTHPECGCRLLGSL
jgi:hypothetical protein